MNFNTMDNWIDHYKVPKNEWLETYITSLYFNFVTMITVGYGDVAATSMYERILCMFSMFVTCGLFGYALNKIQGIFSMIF